MYALRVNISVALICMVKTPVTNSSVVASIQNNNTQDDQCGELQVQRFNENQASTCISVVLISLTILEYVSNLYNTYASCYIGSSCSKPE